jgi:hypothetical protein
MAEKQTMLEIALTSAHRNRSKVRFVRLCDEEGEVAEKSSNNAAQQ